MSSFFKQFNKGKFHGNLPHKEKDTQNIQQHPSVHSPTSNTAQENTLASTSPPIDAEQQSQQQPQQSEQSEQPELPEQQKSQEQLQHQLSTPTEVIQSNGSTSEPSVNSTNNTSITVHPPHTEAVMSANPHMPTSPPPSTQNSFSLGVTNGVHGVDIRDMSIDGSDIPHHSSPPPAVQNPPSMPLPPAPQASQPQVQVKSSQGQPSQYGVPAQSAQAQFVPVLPLTPQSPPLTPTQPQSSSTEPASTHVPAISIPSGLTMTQPKPQRPKLKLADFSLLRTLGTGSFGRVHLAQSKVNQRFYAIKVLKKSEVVRLKQVEHTNNEKAILERVQHPFLVNLWGTFQDDSNLYMVMDYVPGGELFSVLRKSQRFPDHVAKFYAAEVLLAISYLHSKDIIYRDLKPENLLLDAAGHIKITDFGFAKHVPDITWTLCGTPDYLAPEIIQSKGYGKAVDWYSLGVLIFEMLAGYPPFYDDDHLKLYEKILIGKIKWPAYFDPTAKDLLKRLLTLDLSKRYGNLKGGVEDIKRHKWFEGVDFNKVYRREIRAPYVPSIRGEGDASHFDRYPEETEPYGQPAPDLYREKFLDF